MNFLYQIYFLLPNIKYPKLFHKAVNRFYLFIFKNLFNNLIERKIKKMTSSGEWGLNKESRDYCVEISLTSFPARIQEVHKTIETIFYQTTKADSITLYLSVLQFPDKKIPIDLENQKNRGLNIEFVPDDLRSHKKYYYAFGKQKKNLVITIDDDVFYPSNTIESLIVAHCIYPNAVICNRGHQITFENYNVKKYKNWNHNYSSEVPSFSAVATGVGAVLYPPNSYHQDIFKTEIFKDICFHADDLWIKMHTVRNNTKTLSLRTFSRDLINVGKSQHVKLVLQNSIEGGNDKQLSNMLNHYKIQPSLFRN